MQKIAHWISEAIDGSDDVRKLKSVRQEVLGLTRKYPIYPHLHKE